MNIFLLTDADRRELAAIDPDLDLSDAAVAVYLTEHARMWGERFDAVMAWLSDKLSGSLTSPEDGLKLLARSARWSLLSPESAAERFPTDAHLGALVLAKPMATLGCDGCEPAEPADPALFDRALTALLELAAAGAMYEEAPCLGRELSGRCGRAELADDLVVRRFRPTGLIEEAINDACPLHLAASDFDINASAGFDRFVVACKELAAKRAAEREAEPCPAPFAVGDLVQVADGWPLAGQTGRVVEVRNRPTGAAYLVRFAEGPDIVWEHRQLIGPQER